MADEPNYILADTGDDLESQRLALLEQLFDPRTVPRLERLEISPGSRCLEVGAGRGSIARWLSSHVGPQGHVVAADIDCRFLTGLPDNVEVRKLDIRTDRPEPGAYDLVHCRALLLHLADPGDALRRMIAALRPGGTLCVEEADYGLLTFGGHPDGRWCTDLSRKIFEALAAAKIVDTYIGRKVPGLLVDLGLELVGTDVEGSIARSGEPALEWHRSTMEAIAPKLIAGGLLTSEEHARMDEIMHAPSTVLTMPVGFVAWGRRVN
jgi:2-polyprenyl-3-methyl-5-hydroxy-6-metoxy-1,4-benzoquinol methylase